MVDILRITDIVELHTWANDAAYSISSLKEDLEAILPDDTASEEAEAYSNQVFEELEQRRGLLGESYPFDVDGNTIVPNHLKTNSSYLFCLGLSHLTDIPNNMRDVEFESLAKSASEIYFRGTAVRIGAPWKTGEIQSYPDLLQLVTDMIPDLGPPKRDAAPYGGDGGWDVVVVNNFPDRAFSRIIALGNCATGRQNWHTKGNDTEPSYFWDGFTHGPERKNICFRFLAAPFHATDDQRHRKQGSSCILFDRPRLCSLVSTTSDVVMNWLHAESDKALELALI
ncbi:MAG: hypothetical protein ACKVQW_15330 [Pyrinomonadaceae bacterium]